jgi:glucosyl-3-phosphoglycerate phosphatase
VRRLVLIRHGESIWNAERRIQGQACAGLSPRGHAQAAATALALAVEHPEARLLTSDLQRTRETVAPLEAALGRPAEPDARLRERSFGAWERRLRDEVADGDVERWQRWLAGEDVVGEVGGESAEQLADRVAPVLHELLDSTPDGGTTVAITHGGSIWHGIHRLLDLRAGTLGGVDNASRHDLLAVGADGAVLLDRWNDVGHLPPHLRSGWVPGVTEQTTTVSDAPPVGR